VLLIGVALGAATFAVATPEKQTRPFCAGISTTDEYLACATVRNWCPWISHHGQIEDLVVRNLFDDMRRTCPRRWRN
jgi:hypothetical protein